MPDMMYRRFRNMEDGLSAMKTGDYSREIPPFTTEWENAPYEIGFIKFTDE